MTNNEQATSTSRPDALQGFTYKIKSPNYNSDIITVYLTINEDDAGKPYEIFINCKDVMVYEMFALGTLLSSRLLQKGATLEEVADDFEQVSSARTAHMAGAKWFPSLVAHVGFKMRQHDASRQQRLNLGAGAELSED